MAPVWGIRHSRGVFVVDCWLTLGAARPRFVSCHDWLITQWLTPSFPLSPIPSSSSCPPARLFLSISFLKKKKTGPVPHPGPAPQHGHRRGDGRSGRRRRGHHPDPRAHHLRRCHLPGARGREGHSSVALFFRCAVLSREGLWAFKASCMRAGRRGGRGPPPPSFLPLATSGGGAVASEA